MQIDRDTVIQLAEKSVRPFNDAVLDALHADYDEGDGRDDFPNYYRFLYHLSNLLDCRLPQSAGGTLIELGCHYGAASFHFLRGGMHAKAHGIDVDSRVKKFISEEPGFKFYHGRSTDQKCLPIFF